MGRDYDISSIKNTYQKIAAAVSKNRSAFSNYNTVRMREALRYLSAKKFELFLQIPFLLHINAPEYPGFIDSGPLAGGIINFQNSGFFRLAMKEQIFPKSIVDHIDVPNPAVSGLYHIGSLGTFTQSRSSDFDYWVMIDEKQFNKERHENLLKKLDGIIKYCRELYGQEVTFFVMDCRRIVDDNYASFEQEETLPVPKIFLKEEFYRTYLMIAGKIPLWSVMPAEIPDGMDETTFASQILSINDDLINLGPIYEIPYTDILKGLLWHICKSVEDPIKALIKATLVFSYAFGRKEHKTLLCNVVKQGYAEAGIDDFDYDPYKVVFDRILDFHKTCDPKGTHLIKNAVFFRLCSYPDVCLPDKNTPKRQLLNRYIRLWRLKKSQVSKLLAYASWSESEKLILEKAIVQRMAQMFNLALKQVENPDAHFTKDKGEEKNWQILKNKTRVRLRQAPDKIGECSTFLKKRKINALVIREDRNRWHLHARFSDSGKVAKLYSTETFVELFGWILENKLYNRYLSSFNFKAGYNIFEASSHPIEMDRLYVDMFPVKPVSDEIFKTPAVPQKIIIFLFMSKDEKNNELFRAETLIINTWGEIFFHVAGMEAEGERIEQLAKLSKDLSGYKEPDTRMLVYQFGRTYDSNIVYDLKKTFEETTGKSATVLKMDNKPYLDKF